jgi:endonuclease/exonuclease/phosphatase family metal-dependent hydrolase
MPNLSVATYNIHKGFSRFNRRMMVHELRDRLRALNPDIMFLQEVQGLHLGHEMKHVNWPPLPQHEFLAEAVWHETAYTGHAIYEHGHHGNAILSRYPIISQLKEDISAHRFERRGLLHCEIQVPGQALPVHCVCVHLALTGRHRRMQFDRLIAALIERVPAHAPLIISGDFNDWQNRAAKVLPQALGVHEAFECVGGAPARSFPSDWPVLRLDRIYVRGFMVTEAARHFGAPWSQISDHAALTATLHYS